MLFCRKQFFHFQTYKIIFKYSQKTLFFSIQPFEWKALLPTGYMQSNILHFHYNLPDNKTFLLLLSVIFIFCKALSNGF